MTRLLLCNDLDTLQYNTTLLLGIIADSILLSILLAFCAVLWKCSALSYVVELVVVMCGKRFVHSCNDFIFVHDNFSSAKCLVVLVEVSCLICHIVRCSLT